MEPQSFGPADDVAAGLEPEAHAVSPSRLEGLAAGHVDGKDAAVFFAAIKDERQTAVELERKLDELRAINRMVDTVSRASDLDEIYQTALDELQRTFRATRASVLLFDDEGVMRFKAWRRLSDEYRAAVEGHTPWTPETQDPQPIVVRDVREDESLGAFQVAFEQEGIRSLAFIPLVDSGHLLGKFMIYFDEPGDVSPTELRIVQTIAGHIAFAITRKRSETALRDSEERYRRLVEHSPVGVAVHREGRLVFINSAGARIIGATDPADVVGRSILDFVHPDFRAPVLQRMRAIADGAQSLPPLEEKLIRVDGSEVEVEVSVIGFMYQGKPASQIVVTDLTARRRIDREQRLLADAGALLNSTLDYEETLQSITRLAVPSVADWCIIDICDDSGGVDRIAAASARAEDEELSERLKRHYTALPAGSHGITHAIATGRTELMPDVDESMWPGIARDAEHVEMAVAMGVRSYICAPMIARGRMIGAIYFMVGASGRRYSADDVPLAEELARRAALAVENARLYREAQDANRTKSQFLARMSHELRTPLNAIGGYTELLEMGLRGPINTQQREDLTRIQRSQKHLLGLINDLLSYARIESGHVELNIERIIVEDALRAIEPLIEPLASARDVRFVHRASDPGATCRADQDKLNQIVLNLLSNAVKFTEPGGEVSLTSGSVNGQVRISVRDTGRGIAADKLEAIFEPFVQLVTPITRVTEGAGLGLAISRELARAMGGDVTVESEPGRGSVFTLSLPT